MTPPIDTTAGDLPARRALAHVSDDDLVGRLVATATRLAELYDRHGGVAYGLALRIVRTAEAAEDVVQDAFLAVQRGAATFDPRRAPARAWLLLTVRSRALDRLRREGRRPTVELDDERDGAAGGAPDAGAEALRSLEGAARARGPRDAPRRRPPPARARLLRRALAVRDRRAARAAARHRQAPHLQRPRAAAHPPFERAPMHSSTDRTGHPAPEDLAAYLLDGG